MLRSFAVLGLLCSIPFARSNLLINQQVMIYQLVTLPRFSRYNLNYPLFYARTCRVIGLWYKGAYHHAGGGSKFLPRQYNNEQKAAYPAYLPKLIVKRILARCPQMPHVEMMLQGINRFMVVLVLADHMQALPAVRPRSFGYMVILINFTV